MCVKSGHQTCAGTEETVLNRRERVAHHTPLRRKNGRIPGIVNISKRNLDLVGQGLIDAKQLFPPISGWRNGGVVAAVGVTRVGTRRVEIRQAQVAAERRIRQRYQVGVQYGRGVLVYAERTQGQRALQMQ